MAIPALLMTMLFPVIGAAAVFLLLRGHDLPGGGFVAGITMAVAFILQYMARGTVWVEARLRILPVRWMGIGLLLAVGVGAGAWLFGRPFLTSSFSYIEIPFIGRRSTSQRALVRPGRLRVGCRCDRPDADRDRASIRAQSPVAEHRAPVAPAVAPTPEVR